MAENKESPWGQPEFQILYSPPSYAPLDVAKDGVYKFIWEGNNPVAVAWTDGSDGAGVLFKDSTTSAVVAALNFLSDMASVQFPASSAYLVLDTRVVTSDERTGILQDAVDSFEHLIEKGEIPEEKEEDLDD